MKKFIEKFAWTVILLIAPVAGYITFHFQIQPGVASDIPQHSDIIDSVINGTYNVPHPMYHYIVFGLSKFLELLHLPHSYNQAGILFLTFWMGVLAYTIFRILCYYLSGSMSRIYISLLTVALIFVTSFYPFAFNHNLYLGQWSPNIWHNPTMFMVKPFAFLAVFLFLYWESNYNVNSYKLPVYLSVTTIFSLAAKPSFVFFFLPAIFVFLLIYIKKFNISFYKMLVLSFLPAFCYLLLQYFSTYFLQNNGSPGLKDEIVFTLWGVTKLYTSHVFISLILALAFPLFVVLSDLRGFSRDRSLIFAWLCTFFAYLQASFLAEQVKFTQGNFTFGYSLSLSILFIFSVIHLFQAWNKNKRTLVKKLINICGLMLLFGHLFSGVYYYYKYLLVGTYW
ncbi:MAG: hypothetical protein U0T82_10605 [Bacteroidales bacterium]